MFTPVDLHCFGILGPIKQIRNDPVLVYRWSFGNSDVNAHVCSLQSPCVHPLCHAQSTQSLSIRRQRLQLQLNLDNKLYANVCLVKEYAFI